MSEKSSAPAALEALEQPIAASRSPFLRAPEGIRTIFLVTLAATCGPLTAGVVLFGWRAAWVAALAIGGCALFEWAYYRVTRVPALVGRSHAYLTGVLLALTLPPFVDWYVPLIAAAFAIIVGKAVFGGVGHFLWQPALIGRLAVAVLFAQHLAAPAVHYPNAGPVLTPGNLLVGDILDATRAENYRRWRQTKTPEDADAVLVNRPAETLSRLTRGQTPAYSGIAFAKSDLTGQTKPAALGKLPPLSDLLYGLRPGGIGETCILIIIVAGLYLVYRNYVKAHLPLSMIAAAWCVVAICPVYLAGPNNTVRTVWWPLLAEGLDTGFTYVNYQLVSGELILAALFLATEMTSRPVTAGGQVIFGLGCGALAMLLQLYVNVPIPCYMAVLAMNTLTPLIESVWRPRVLGQGFLSRWFSR